MSIEHRPDDDFVTAEAELLASTIEFPEMPATLRRDVLKASRRAFHRSRFCQRMQVSVAVSVACLLCLILGGFYVSLWNPATASSAVVSGNKRQNSHSAAKSTNRVLSMNALTNDWAMVDAYGAIRSKRARAIRRAFWE